MATDRIFAVNPAASPAATLQRNAVAQKPSAAVSTLNSSTRTNTMEYSLNTQQGRDAWALNTLTTNALNKALSALQANKPTEAAGALREALDFADRLVTADTAVLLTNARQVNEFHGYDAGNPMGDVKPDPVFGSYDLNNP